MDTIRTILCDDHILFREGLRLLLENEEYIEYVAMASNGKEAIKLAQELRPDVALIDIAMPEMDGFETAKRIRAVCPRTAILIISAYKHNNYVRSAMQAGADGYLLKNTHPRELINAIRLVHAGGAVFSLETTRETVRKVFAADDKKGVDSNELNSRELEVVKLAASGMSNKAIASTMYISDNTVRTHFVSIFKKLGAGSRTEVVSLSLQRGLITLDDLHSSS